MAKALDFIDPEKLSMTVVLTAMNRFLNETDGTLACFETARDCVMYVDPGNLVHGHPKIGDNAFMFFVVQTSLKSISGSGWGFSMSTW